MARYIDDCHTAIGGSVYHIREYASYLEQIGGKAIPIRPGLPEKCYAVLPSGDEIITVRHGEAGYYHTDKYGHDRAHVQAIVDEYNAQINVTKGRQRRCWPAPCSAGRRQLPTRKTMMGRVSPSSPNTMTGATPGRSSINIVIEKAAISEKLVAVFLLTRSVIVWN